MKPKKREVIIRVILSCVGSRLSSAVVRHNKRLQKWKKLVWKWVRDPPRSQWINTGQSNALAGIWFAFVLHLKFWLTQSQMHCNLETVTVFKIILHAYSGCMSDDSKDPGWVRVQVKVFTRLCVILFFNRDSELDVVVVVGSGITRSHNCSIFSCIAGIHICERISSCRNIVIHYFPLPFSSVLSSFKDSMLALRWRCCPLPEILLQQLLC